MRRFNLSRAYYFAFTARSQRTGGAARRGAAAGHRHRVIRIDRIRARSRRARVSFLLLFSVNARLDAIKPQLCVAIRATARLRDRARRKGGRKNGRSPARTISRWAVANWSRWDRFIGSVLSRRVAHTLIFTLLFDLRYESRSVPGPPPPSDFQ